jgi:hypothetical protein
MIALVGNIAWAYYCGPELVTYFRSLGMNVPDDQQIPTIKTRIITFYSTATGRLTSDEYHFFMRI